MRYLIQKDTDDKFDIDRLLVIEQLEHDKTIHTYEETTLKELRDTPKGYVECNMIPIGTIEFVTMYLNKTQGFIKENPIEIPKYLRKEEFLHREYSIVTWDKIPRSGEYFIKDASTLKHFSYNGSLEHFIQEEMFEKPQRKFDTSLKLSKDALYQVSELVNPLSEYRVYVVRHKIEAISNYNGDPTIFPDINIINKAIMLIEAYEKYLKSYTIDVMITKDGTSLIEIHNFTSCGLYTTLWGSNILWGYVDGIEYLLNDNKKIEV